MGGLLYHRTQGLYVVGDKITGGNWGRLIFGFGPNHVCFYREYLLEKIRLADTPEKPSRMKAVFAFEDCEYAMNWDRKAPLQEYVYAVRLSDPECSIHRGDMAWIDSMVQCRSFDAVEGYARKYWSGDERDPKSMEVIAPCDLIVEGRITKIQENGFH